MSAPSAPPATGRLLRVLGVGFGVAVTVGNTIGAGILRTAGDVAAQLPHPGLFLAVWVLGGLYALMAAFSFAELGTLIPRSGGHYVFAHRALGEYPGFVIGWSDWLSNAGSSAAVSIVIGEYSGLLFPPLAPFSTWIACGVVVGFAVLQWRGIRTGSRTQNISSLVKALALLALVAACFFSSARAADTLASPPVPHGAQLLIAFIFALQAVIYTYDGWAGIIYFSEETTDPQRDVPRSMFIGTLSVIAIYVLLSAATIKILPISAIAGNKLALGTAAKLIWGTHGDTVLQAVLIVTMLSAINAYQLMTCRIIYSMSVDGLFTKRAAHVNAGGTPDFALLISTVVAVLFILTGTFNQVIAVMAFFFVCNYIAGLTSLFVMRHREPDRVRTFRAWGYPWTTGIALAAYSLFLVGAIWSDRRNSAYSLLLLAASYPIYRLFKKIY